VSHKLENYLRTYRKRSGLSQDEVAFLSGCQTGTKVSRYELFAGAYQKVEKKIINRAQLLARKLNRATPNRMATRKLEILQAITSGSGTGPDKLS
jgi:transcriptional regulator with XRE-family HTH domain